jgi:hypothetical protein
MAISALAGKCDRKANDEEAEEEQTSLGVFFFSMGIRFCSFGGSLLVMC